LSIVVLLPLAGWTDESNLPTGEGWPGVPKILPKDREKERSEREVEATVVTLRLRATHVK